ncbi:hypothetical protein HYV30_02390 [Candidatus Kaiserbacteria bacterium]|nr:hypothetical protein [Candidatus Kaiserbacteria bacterium]
MKTASPALSQLEVPRAVAHVPDIEGLENADAVPLLSSRRRAAHRLFSALGVFAFGMVLNSALWLLGRATEYQLLPVSLLCAALVYGVLWILE